MKKKRIKKDLQSKLKIAVVVDPLIKYEDWYTQLKYILKVFPNFELFTSYYNPELVSKYLPKVQIHDTFLQLIAPESNGKKIWLELEKLAYKTFFLKNFDAVVSISSRSARFVRTRKGMKHISIIINPRKFLVNEKLQRKDRGTILNLDTVIVNSDFDKKRIHKMYNVDSKVVYPPVNVEIFNPKQLLHRKENWFLMDVDVDIRALRLVIKSAVRANVGLKIAGSLKDRVEVEEITKGLQVRGLVKFLGGVSSAERIKLIQKCKAYIYPVKKSDFPKEVVEANAAGTAVIGYAQEVISELISINHPKTGVLFDKYNSKLLSKILKNFNGEEFDGKNCIIKAQEFDPSIFTYKLKTYVEDTVQSS